MANVLRKDKQIAIISALAEGSSMHSISRMTGIHRDTICRLGVRSVRVAPRFWTPKCAILTCRFWSLTKSGASSARRKSTAGKRTIRRLATFGHFARLMPKPKLCLSDNPRQHITVLHIPPATTPLRAVQVAIAGIFREQEAHAES